LISFEYLSFEICREAEYAREYENRSAITIQSTWRGFRVRFHNKLVVLIEFYSKFSMSIYRYLNRCALIIQRWWRGYQAKAISREKLKV
jgi:hypothetical protein